MPYQTSYSQFQPSGYPGMQADLSEWDASSKTATATIAFGAPVQRNGDESCSPYASGGEYLGIAKATHKVTGTVADSYEQYDTVPVANEGVWWGIAGAAITVGAGLNWDTVAGRWTTAATSGTVLAVAGAEAESAAAANGSLFKVRLRRIPS
ncbi:DUF2190 family protein [Novosphingobium olei]|uniref:DUF2190 family protein n=1 Tax=Novosphingobium olei TaxID=2728851 RepID=UPI00309254FF|nr:DUF2190 family protein [Novosphingobium olei]